ncbi:MAG: hypothetical protein KDI21_07200, partial [Halieaceae bacterium]|nr:hypothetical protein [Halieaceae bacterium]
EPRRAAEDGRSRWSADHEKKKVIPANLNDCIIDSGETAAGKPVYVISVACLPGGALRIARN